MKDWRSPPTNLISFERIQRILEIHIPVCTLYCKSASYKTPTSQYGESLLIRKGGVIVLCNFLSTRIFSKAELIGLQTKALEVGMMLGSFSLKWEDSL